MSWGVEEREGGRRTDSGGEAKDVVPVVEGGRETSDGGMEADQSLGHGLTCGIGVKAAEDRHALGYE